MDGHSSTGGLGRCNEIPQLSLNHMDADDVPTITATERGLVRNDATNPFVNEERMAPNARNWTKALDTKAEYDYAFWTVCSSRTLYITRSPAMKHSADVVACPPSFSSSQETG